MIEIGKPFFLPTHKYRSVVNYKTYGEFSLNSHVLYLRAKLRTIGLGTPCIPRDKELFAMGIKINIGNVMKALFWDGPWLDGRLLKDIIPLIFKGSKRKRCSNSKALHDNIWISKSTLMMVSLLITLFDLPTFRRFFKWCIRTSTRQT
jgi:hypothetical protein